MNKRKFIMFWSAAVGSMDVLTGAALVVSPVLVLHILGIAPPSPDALVYLRWVGVFVGGVGLSYAMVFGDRRRGMAVWMVTALLRTLVAVFVISQIDAGLLAPAWLLVALTDAVVAVVQMVVVRTGWWEDARW